jgi:hypothetical protein
VRVFRTIDAFEEQVLPEVEMHMLGLERACERLEAMQESAEPSALERVLRGILYSDRSIQRDVPPLSEVEVTVFDLNTALQTLRAASEQDQITPA